MPDTPTNTSPKQRWKDAAAKFKRAIVPEQSDVGKLSEALIDCVRVRVIGTIEQDKVKPYLEEIARGKQTLQGYEYQILRMEPEELKKHQIFYEPSSASLKDYNDNAATTEGKESKHTKNIQAFVLAKDGSLYMGTHKGQYDPVKPTLTHASFLGGRPAEMAGMISITKEGKINMLSSDSGHYAPEPLDMYRGIKRMQELMPNAFTPDAKIKYYDKSGSHSMNISEFIEMMDKPGIDNKPLHQELRDQRVQQAKEYSQNLKGAVSIILETDNLDLPSAIANMTEEKQQELQKGLKNPMVSVSLKGSNGKTMTYGVSDIVTSVINSGTTDAMKKLLENGIVERKEFQALRPLYYATSQGKTEIVKTMLDNPIMQESLRQEIHSPDPSTLHMAAAHNNQEVINAILQNPTGYELLAKKDLNGHTPLEVANNYKKPEASKILYNAFSELTKKRLTEYLSSEIKGKEIISTPDKERMENKVIEILYPLSATEKDKKDIIEAAGSIVRDSVKIAGKKLDWKQKIAAIGDVIKDSLSKVFSNQNRQKFKDILKDTSITSELKKLHKDYKLTEDLHTVVKPSQPPLNKTHINSKGDKITRM